MRNLIKGLVVWLIGTFLPGYHLRKNPVRKDGKTTAEIKNDTV